jgi:GT2 family glycosyltransferase
MTASPPLISVCIANYNGMAVIDDCMASVLNQTGIDPEAIEILIHDDASTDNSVPHIRNHYPQARLIESTENVGFCVANNRMAKAARGEYLLLLNNDAALFPDALATLHTAAREMGLPTILGLPQYDFDTSELLDIGSLLDPFLNPVPNLDPERSEVGLVMGACLWIPKPLWDELGGFPEWFESIGEDLYLCYRARLMGYSVRALGTSGFRHRVGQSFGGGKVTTSGRLVTTKRRRALSERNKSFVMAMMYPPAFLYTVFPLHLCLLLFEGAIIALIKNDRSVFQGIYLACIRALWQERWRLQALRHDIQEHRQAPFALLLAVHQFMPHKLRMLIRHGIPKLR